MGYAEMDKISLTDGALVFENIFTEDLSNNPNIDYTEADKIVPGAVYLYENRIILNLPQYNALTIPVYNYDPATSPSVSAGSMHSDAIQEVLAGSRELYGISADGFGGDTGWMSFSDYCQPGAADQYGNQPLQLIKYGWVDINQDGGQERILLLGEAGQTVVSRDKYVILSEQAGMVYAYCINYSCDKEIYQDGVFAGESDWSFCISFYRNQCYIYTKAHDVSIPAVEWET
jgi:hypothetical protein